MCILICSKAHSGYPFILLSNRDEFFTRPTAPAAFVTPDILRPTDLARPEHGTWIGITKSGKISVLVNYRQYSGSPTGKISRGLIPLGYLESETDIDPQIWGENYREKMDDFKDVGGFSLLFGEIKMKEKGLNSLFVLSNRTDTVVEAFDSKITRKEGYLALSNSTIWDPWPKVEIGEDLLAKVIESDLNGEYNSEEMFIEALFGILNYTDERLKKSHTSFEKAFKDIPHSIFIPPLHDKGHSSNYGTRTQTVILVDNSGSVLYLERNTSEKSTQKIEFQIGKFTDRGAHRRR